MGLMPTANDFLFHSFAGIAVLGAILVVVIRNPVYSALFLALTMSMLGALFFVLEAYFVAAAQITVYAGAVMVLFVMVLMLFDLKHQGEQVFKFSPMTVVKTLSAALLCGFLIGVAWLAISSSSINPAAQIAPNTKAADLEKPKALETSRVETIKIKEADPEPKEANGEDSLRRSQDIDAVAAALPTPDAVLGAQVEEFGSTKVLSQHLFTKYVFAFEALSLLLLVAIVGVIALAKSKGERTMWSTDAAAFVHVGLNHYLVLSAILFSIGILGVLLRRNALVILMSIELMLNAVNLDFVAFAKYTNNIDGQVLVFFVMTIAAAEAGVGLAIAVAIFKRFKEVNISRFENLKG